MSDSGRSFTVVRVSERPRADVWTILTPARHADRLPWSLPRSLSPPPREQLLVERRTEHLLFKLLEFDSIKVALPDEFEALQALAKKPIADASLAVLL